ncbi:hypothetical protein [Streptomyces sp. PTD5-9]
MRDVHAAANELRRMADEAQQPTAPSVADRIRAALGGGQPTTEETS